MKWHKGPPPSIGWWPASVCFDTECIRWWDGNKWGDACYANTSVKVAEIRAQRRANYQNSIKWTNRPFDWPERSKT
jgi:hypothetical protein